MNFPEMGAHDYQADGKRVDVQQFTALACDPERSVVVEACAGSGKTWLLVARLVRLLLAGVAPQALLAITFTRKAAEEMRTRLLTVLEVLASASDAEVIQQLQQRGLTFEQAQQAVPRARQLYSRVLAGPGPLSIDTFHGWFGSLLRGAPLSSGIPQGYQLREDANRLRREAWAPFWRSLGGQPAESPMRQAYETLVSEVGDFNTDRLLHALFAYRSEWWSLCQQRDPGESLRETLGKDAHQDPAIEWLADSEWRERAWQVAGVLGKGGKNAQKRAQAIEQALGMVSALASQEALQALCEVFLTAGKPRSTSVTAEMRNAVAADVIDAMEAMHADLCAELIALRTRCQEARVWRINQALFRLGSTLIETYQQHKAKQRILDFSDLEWQAARLMANEDTAAYLQMRLDARYKHILLDEFQDTNPLQWQILQGWLQGYSGSADGLPTIFMVGDPKQSIYRFRRADARLFDTARQLLVGQFGARQLRTNRTRRNAPAVLACVNAVFEAAQKAGEYPLYATQTTAWQDEGAGNLATGTWLLPLVPQASRKTASDDGHPARLRDTLTEPRMVRGDETRYEEGRRVAAWAAHFYQTTQVVGVEGKRPARWSDICLLVRRRRYLAEYERAFREAGIPCVSPRKGGLLATLEALDLMALLRFLMTPEADLALAHVLKSPLCGATDADLMRLAEQSEQTWWQRLCHLANQTACSENLQRAQQQLSDWLQVAPRLPVHDVLDHVYFTGEVKRRYAEVTPAALREQVGANLDAFLQLALELDGGRYPSLPKFMAELAEMQRGEEEDSPDEGEVAGEESENSDLVEPYDEMDAVRILTIHAAKGLEAPVVFLLDANHSDSREDTLGILIDWPPGACAPSHLSAYGAREWRGKARADWFAQETGIAMRENWNLLYVALTRAQQILVVSGVAENQKKESQAADANSERNSWYARLRAANTPVLETSVSALPLGRSATLAGMPTQQMVPAELVSYLDFRPPSDAAWHTLLKGEQSLQAKEHALYDAEAVAQGELLHVLLERVTRLARLGGGVPKVPDAEIVASWLRSPLALSKQAVQAAERILQNPALHMYFNADCYLSAWNELELYEASGALLRIDRLVELPDALVILDYKLRVLELERQDYVQQLQRYQQALRLLRPDKPIRAVLIDGQGQEMALVSLEWPMPRDVGGVSDVSAV